MWCQFTKIRRSIVTNVIRLFHEKLTWSITRKMNIKFTLFVRIAMKIMWILILMWIFLCKSLIQKTVFVRILKYTTKSFMSKKTCLISQKSWQIPYQNWWFLKTLLISQKFYSQIHMISWKDCQFSNFVKEPFNQFHEKIIKL